MTTVLSGSLEKQPSMEDIERAVRLKRLSRRKRARLRKLKQYYMKQAQAQAVKLRQKMRSASWSQGQAW